MGAIEVAGLVALALVDSTSIGTLVIPLVLVLRPRIRPVLVLLYLASIAVFYLVVGLLLLTGLGAVLPELTAALETPAAAIAQTVLGVALIVLSFVVDPAAVARRRERRGLPPRPPARWQTRLERAADRPTSMVSLALVAGLLEVATMVPYLAAIGIITAAELPPALDSSLVGGYVLVMVLPACVLLVVRLAVGSRLERPLQRLRGWVLRHADSATTWGLFLVGLLLIRYGVEQLVRAVA